MSEWPDPLIAVIAYLKGDADVTAITGDDVYGNRLPEALDPVMPRFALLVTHAGGGALGTGWQDWTDLRFDLTAYGPTEYEANRLWRAAHRCMKQLAHAVSGGVLLHWARQAGGPNALRDPDTTWPYTVSSWQVLLSEVEVSV